MTVVTSLQAYREAQGEIFSLTADGQPEVSMTLKSVKVLADEPGHRSFSLMFEAPPPLLRQNTYRLDHPRIGECHLFLVPIGKSPGGYLYQAAFNLMPSIPASA